ncbi:MAG: peptide deformylase [Chitinispirillaceae bacterium]|nr:peptide deformylase [Chitinispirillaceae bacterium]
MEDILTTDLSKRPFLLRLYPDAVLRRRSESVSSFTGELDRFLCDMLVFMKEHNGAGLAAPQVGIGLRAVAAEIEGRPVMLVNPEIAGSTKAMEWKEEGCLSLPGRAYQVERLTFIEVKARTPSGSRLHFEAEGLFARVLQHEIDHLDGVLICDKGENLIRPGS